MDQVAQAVELHRRQHVQKEGGDVETIKLTIPDGAHKVQPLGPAPQLKIRDLMPKGQAAQTGKLNPEMVANMPDKTNCAEFFIIQQIVGINGMSIPSKDTFDSIMDNVALKLPDRRCIILILINNLNAQNNFYNTYPLYPLQIGQTKDQHMDGPMPTLNEAQCRRKTDDRTNGWKNKEFDRRRAANEGKMGRNYTKIEKYAKVFRRRRTENLLYLIFIHPNNFIQIKIGHTSPQQGNLLNKCAVNSYYAYGNIYVILAEVDSGKNIQLSRQLNASKITGWNSNSSSIVVTHMTRIDRQTVIIYARNDNSKYIYDFN